MFTFLLCFFQFSIFWCVSGYVCGVCMRGGSHPVHTNRVTRTTAVGHMFFVGLCHGKMVDEKKWSLMIGGFHGINYG